MTGCLEYILKLGVCHNTDWILHGCLKYIKTILRRFLECFWFKSGQCEQRVGQNQGKYQDQVQTKAKS